MIGSAFSDNFGTRPFIQGVRIHCVKRGLCLRELKMGESLRLFDAH